jgi:uncharacterized protein YecE (DUF72 family)
MSAVKTKQTSLVRVGIGGWTFAPWRGTFYPDGLVQKDELHYASRQVTTIEINGTFYGTQKPASFRKWHDETPDDFVFALKAPRFATNRRVLADAGESIQRFMNSGLSELGNKLGPINWQFAPTKQFDPEDFEAFLSLLPKQLDGNVLRHAVELRHASFAVPECIALLRRHDVAVVGADAPEYPQIFDSTASFMYLRLQNAAENKVNGYGPTVLDQWAKRARLWSEGETPGDVPVLESPRVPDKASRKGALRAETHIPRPVFLYFINGYKPKAPAAAVALLKKLP